MDSLARVAGGIFPILLRSALDLLLISLIFTMYGEWLAALTIQYGVNQIESKVNNAKTQIEQLAKLKVSKTELTELQKTLNSLF